MEQTSFVPAVRKDLKAVRALLREGDLPSADIDPGLRHFLVAREDGAVVGCVGLEPANDVALLRSLAVTAARRKHGMATALCDRIEGYAASLGVLELYLLTTTAADFFGKRGYARVERAGAPPAMQATEEFKSCCPSTAVCMSKRIDAVQ